MRRIVIETPLKAETDEQYEANRQYARACCREALLVYDEAPFASHLLYDQPGLLHDDEPSERKIGIKAGLVYARDAEATVVYVDHGMSDGMRQGIEAAEEAGRPVEYRQLGVR